MLQEKHERPKNAIYTRTGDQGMTSLVSGRVKKTDPRIRAIGEIDSLNAQLGYLIDQTRPISSLDLGHHLEEIQNLLFALGAQLADIKGKYNFVSLSASDVINLEKEIDRMTESLPPLKNFILPRGHPIISWTHVVRTTCRSAERVCLELEEIPPHLIAFLNRLSDYFFTLARYLAHNLQVEEVIWVPKK